MVREPPEGFAFESNLEPSIFDEFTRAPSYAPVRKAVAAAYNGLFRAVRTPRLMPITCDCDLVHMDGCILPITRKPWIIGSIEHASAFFSFDDRWYSRPTSKRALGRFLSSNRCRRVLPQSEASLETLRLGLGEHFELIRDKCEVSYPAVPTHMVTASGQKGRDDGAIRILFVGSHFFDKGGRETFYAYRRLRKKYDLELILVAGAPRHHRSLFQDFVSKIREEPGVRLYSNVSRSFLWKECFGRSDIFCFPSYMETFGYVLLEAMANSLAIVTTDAFAIPELVQNGKTGLIVHTPWASFVRGRLRSPSSLQDYRQAVIDERRFAPVVDELVTALSQLIEDDRSRLRYAAAARKEVVEGRFSTSARNRQLSRIYREALEEG